MAIAQVSIPFQVRFLKSVPLPAPVGLSPGQARRVQSSGQSDLTIHRHNVHRTIDLVGFYPITQSSSGPIVRFDAMSRLLFALWSPISNSTIGFRFYGLKIDLEPGGRSTTSVFASSAKENLTAARWKSAAWAIANMNCAVLPKAATQGRICGFTQQHRWSLT
jgi:hypothetical protein